MISLFHLYFTAVILKLLIPQRVNFVSEGKFLSFMCFNFTDFFLQYSKSERLKQVSIFSFLKKWSQKF